MSLDCPKFSYALVLHRWVDAPKFKPRRMTCMMPGGGIGSGDQTFLQIYLVISERVHNIVTKNLLATSNNRDYMLFARGFNGVPLWDPRKSITFGDPSRARHPAPRREMTPERANNPRDTQKIVTSPLRYTPAQGDPDLLDQNIPSITMTLGCFVPEPPSSILNGSSPMGRVFAPHIASSEHKGRSPIATGKGNLKSSRTNPYRIFIDFIKPELR